MDFDKDAPQIPPVEIPASALSPETLASVIATFVEREGTDYGAQEVSHEKKISDVRKQLDRGDIKLIFDPNTQSVTFMTKVEWDGRRNRSTQR